MGPTENYEAKLQALRDTIDGSISDGGAHGDDAVGQHVDAALDDWEIDADAR